MSIPIPKFKQVLTCQKTLKRVLYSIILGPIAQSVRAVDS